MTYSVIGCGENSQNWTPNGYSIGVNDSWKFGKPTDGLLVCNHPQRFSPERQQTIINSKPKHFYSDSPQWSTHFDYLDKQQSRYKRLHSNNPALPKVRFMQWANKLYPETVFYSNSSPFIAVSLAYTLGAKDIILWGVDMMNHHIFNEGNPYRNQEVRSFLELFSALQEQGVSVWLGCECGVFDKYLKVYDSTK